MTRLHKTWKYSQAKVNSRSTLVEFDKQCEVLMILCTQSMLLLAQNLSNSIQIASAEYSG